MILERTLQRDKNSLLILSRVSPVATATLKGRVFDQLGAVRLSFRIDSIISGATGVGRKSRVLRREARNSENASGLNLLPCAATRELYRKVMGAQWLSWSQIQGMTKSKNEKELPFESIG
jgi:hypothetical protein